MTKVIRKLCCYLIISILLIIFLANFSYAALSCSLRQTSCNSGEVAVLKLSGGATTDRHAAYPDYNVFNNVVCCSSTDDLLSITCSGDKSAIIVKLQKQYDAHAERSDSNLFANPTNICLSGTNQKIDCRYSDNVACDPYETGVVELSGNIDANTAYYGTTTYPLKVCCKQVLGEAVEGTIVYINNGQDQYDAVAGQNSQWWNCNTDSIIPAGNVFTEGTTKQAGTPILHDYLCYYNPQSNIERIAECIGDDAASYSQTAAGGSWHVYGTKIVTSINQNIYCCRDERWNIDLDTPDCKAGGTDSACELNGFKLATGGESLNTLFGGYNPGNKQGDCCGDDASEFYITDKCNAASNVSAKCCNLAADKIDDNGNCVAECCTADETALCTDNKDNDCDGLIDCADSDCKGKTGTGGQGLCCQQTSVATDCQSLDAGTCGAYACTNNLCNIVENKAKCTTSAAPDECRKFNNICAQSGGQYNCVYDNDNSLCKTQTDSQDCDKFCDTDFKCKDLTTVTGSGDTCRLKNSDCIKQAPPYDSLSYTLPNDPAACPCHALFSSCQTDQSKFTTSLPYGEAKCQ